jgi:hypothetical protein
MSANGHHPQPAQAVQGNDGNGLRHPSERQAFWDVNSQKRTPGVSRQRISLNVRQAPRRSKPSGIQIWLASHSSSSSTPHLVSPDAQKLTSNRSPCARNIRSRWLAGLASSWCRSDRAGTNSYAYCRQRRLIRSVPHDLQPPVRHNGAN